MQLFRRIWFEPQLGEQISEISAAAQRLGIKTGFREGFTAHAAGKRLEDGPLEKTNPEKTIGDQLTKLEKMTFPVIEHLKALADDIDPLGALKYLFDESDRLGAESKKAEEDAAKAAGEGPSGAGGFLDVD